MSRQNLIAQLLIGSLLVLLAACAGTPAATGPTAAPATQPPPPTTAVPPTTAPTLAATEAPPSPTSAPATAEPTSAPAASAQIAVQLQDNSVQLMDLSGKQTPLYKANAPVDRSSIFPPGNVAGSTLYLPLSPTQPGAQPSVVRVDASGAQTLSFIKGMVYGLAADASRIAWGAADLSAAQPSSQLMVANLDGSNAHAFNDKTFTGIPRVSRVMRWSNDGSRLYFGNEPLGLGGYILFSGLTNLWMLDPSTGKTTELVHERAPNAAICIDDLSPDEKLVADHCGKTSMEVIDIASQKVTTPTLPASAPQFGSVGGARFSPDSTRLAYALARQNPDDEQGWVALADLGSGKSTLIATSPAKDYFQVVAWLDANAIVLQSSGDRPGVWTVNADGSNLKRLGDGTFLGLLPGGPGQGGSGSGSATACGEITMRGTNPPGDASALQAEQCFWQAFQQCKPATLKVTMMGVDAGTIDEFSLRNNGGRCQVLNSVIRYVIPRPTPAPTTSPCSGVALANDGLLFKNCGDQGDILIPAP